MAKVLAKDVHVTAADNTVTILHAGAKVPEKFEEFVTNPAAFAEELKVESNEDEVTGYAANTVPELIELLKSRELPTKGNKSELIERLEYDDLEKEESDEE